jgi:hypothetical protein
MNEWVYLKSHRARRMDFNLSFGTTHCYYYNEGEEEEETLSGS